MLDLPGHITGIVGEMGSGKSLIALKLALNLAEDMQFRVQTNFALDAIALQRYCLKCKYFWLYSGIKHRKGNVTVKAITDHKGQSRLDKWMNEPYTLYVLDEAGIFLNSRRFQSTPPQFLADLAQIRHDNRKLFWIAQYYDQVDRQLRELTQSYVHCDSICRYSRELRNTKIEFLRYYFFASRNYKRYVDKVLNKKSGIKAFFQSASLGHKSFFGRLSESDLLLFDCYPSLDRIENDPILLYPPGYSPSAKVIDLSAYRNAIDGKNTNKAL